MVQMSAVQVVYYETSTTPKFARRSSAAERPTMRFSTRSSYRSGVIEMWLRDPRGMAIVAAPPLKLEVVGEL